MANFIKLENKNILDNLQNHEIGEVAYITDTKEFYTYKENEGWVKMNTDSDLFQFSLYQMNQMVLRELPKLSDEDLIKAKQTISDYVYSLEHNDDYFMLLCHELKYFTVFTKDEECNEEEKITNVLIECVNSIGDIKSIERTNDTEAIEIWITTPEDETYVMYFFDYGKGIVPCRI